MLDASIIRTQLLEVAGVSPSSHWFDDCLAALQLSGQGQSSDAFLQQILYHDLRDVVRELAESDHSENYGPFSEGAIALRQAQAQSMLASNQYKAMLPSTFRLLVQVEEILDVSANAQARYEHGPASNASPTPVGNQQKRCLKIVYSDGYDNDEILVATETSPIPSLSVQSRAGCKVILTGPLQIRHGMALWNSTTTFVLGGEVESLVQVQQAAIEQAKRVAGVGIDPTIKALIWNNQQPLGEDGEPQDEAEHENRDLLPPPASTLNMSTADPPQPIQHMNRIQPNNQLRLGAATLSPSRTASRSTSPVPPEPVPLPHATLPPRQPVSAAAPVPQSFTSQANNGSSQPRNPYATNSRVERAPRSTNTSPVPMSIHGASTNAHNVADHAPRSTNTSPFPMSINSASTNAHNVVDLTDSVESPSGHEVDDDVHVAMDTTYPEMSTNSEMLTYKQLLEIINLAIRDRDAYQQAYGVTWRVQLHQVGVKEYFNIEKRKNRPKGDDKKYEYAMTAKFKGPGDLDTPITFKVDSAIVEPYFQLSPADMRQLRKDDKDRANVLVRDGGKLVHVDLHQVRLYQVALLLSPEEFFQERSTPATLDGPTPLLILKKV